MVERFFRDLTQHRLRQGIFRDVEELVMAVGDYIDRHNQNPKPFILTKKASDILEKCQPRAEGHPSLICFRTTLAEYFRLISRIDSAAFRSRGHFRIDQPPSNVSHDTGVMEPHALYASLFLNMGSENNDFNDRVGTGDWSSFSSMRVDLECIYSAAEEWKRAIHGVDQPWLCWNVSNKWCKLQQRLVKKFGWTPIVGFDPRVGPPPLEAGAVLIDFNKQFGFPVMWPQFPLEFAFRWIPNKLAFWHADLLCRYQVMQQLVGMFSSMQNGETAAVLDKGGIRNLLNTRSHRFWEVCGCTTQAASENQFFNGTGWWRHFDQHIKCVLDSEKHRRKSLSYDSGTGILYWKNYYRGRVREIDVRLIDEGHCSEIRATNYKHADSHLTPLRNLQAEIDANYSLDEVAARLGIADLL